MGSMRDIDRAMKREIAKRSRPLKFVRIEFSDSPYQEITSRGKLLGVLSYLLRTGDYGRFAGKGARSNVYMDMKGREAAFKRTCSFIDRNNIFPAIHRCGKKIESDFDGHTCLETVWYCFEPPERERKEHRVTYDRQGTSILPMSDKYTLGLYTHCTSAGRAVPEDVGIPSTGFSEKEWGIVSLEGAHDVLFQCLLFNTMKCGEGMLHIDFYTIYCLK